MAKVTMYQIEVLDENGWWMPRGNPFDSRLLAEIAVMEWLKDRQTRIEPVAIDIKGNERGVVAIVLFPVVLFMWVLFVMGKSDQHPEAKYTPRHIDPMSVPYK